MSPAKNYKTVTKFVKVMSRILWPLFLLDTVYRRSGRTALIRPSEASTCVCMCVISQTRTGHCAIVHNSCRRPLWIYDNLD